MPMRRTLIAVAAFVGLFSVTQTPAHAQYISKYNPYRAFNTSGVNYGSQQLQYEHDRVYGRNAYAYRSAYRGWYSGRPYTQRVYRSGWYDQRVYTSSCR
jgi:hypothetical protein